MAHASLRILVGALVLAALTGCRAGDPASCERTRACRDPSAADPVDLAFSAEGYGSCEDAVGDGDCGIDAERLRRCVDAIEVQLCVPPAYQSRSPEDLLETTPCTRELEQFRRCEAGGSSSTTSYDDTDDGFWGYVGDDDSDDDDSDDDDSGDDDSGDEDSGAADSSDDDSGDDDDSSDEEPEWW